MTVATRGNQRSVMQRWPNVGKLLMEIEAAVIYRKFVQGRSRKPALSSHRLSPAFVQIESEI